MNVAEIDRAMQRGLRAGGFVRRHRPLTTRGKEWLHFCIATPELFVLINFSFSEQEGAGEIARVTCVVSDGTWHGDVDTIASKDVRIRPGRIELALGESHVRLRDDGMLAVRAVLPRRKIEIDLALRPASFPLLVNNVPAGDSALIHWFVLPRSFASGSVRIAGACHVLADVPAYHDHNWGTFGWGADFSWVWGFAHDARKECPWSLTFDRFTNRSRTIDRARAILIWRDGREHRLFRDQDVSIETHGLLHTRSMLRVPRPMALLVAGAATDVPERLSLSARAGNDVIEAEVVCVDACQVLVPDDHGTGTTIITEARCRVAMSGRIRGERVELEGTGIFEFLGN